jgi:hypothetical protein
MKILNPTKFISIDQVAVSASTPPPLPFFLQMFGPCGPKHINYGQYDFHNNNQFLFLYVYTEQVAVSASIPPPLLFFGVGWALWAQT